MYRAVGFPSLLALALLLGVGGAATFPLPVTILADLYRGARNSTAQGLRVGVIGLTTLTVPAAAGYAAEVAWNAPFLLFGLAVPVGLLAGVRLAETVDATPSGGAESSTEPGDGPDARDADPDPGPDPDGGPEAATAPAPASVRGRIAEYAAAMRAELRDRTLADGVVGGFVMYW